VKRFYDVEDSKAEPKNPKWTKIFWLEVLLLMLLHAAASNPIYLFK